MPVTFFTGNFLEDLAIRLAEDIKSNALSPFDRPVVIVQSHGMMKWLSLRISEHNGICANIEFRFPKDFIYEIFHRIAGRLPSESLYEKETLTWKIMEMLPRFTDQREFYSLKSYLKQRESSLKYYQLAEKIASIYDQYLVFRPQWIFNWQNKKDNHWQAVLWRAIVEESGTGHPAQLREEFKDEFERNEKTSSYLPKHVYIFGISSLPKFHVEVFNLISEKTDVKLYHLNPCREYWGKADRRTESGLIASMGKLGRDFFEILLNNNIYANEDQEFFTEIERKDILSAIQSDILELADPMGPEEKFCVDEGDRSIEIHSCHSPMREIEVLFDNLLGIFNSDGVSKAGSKTGGSKLTPDDVVVMAPDIEVYAPYINAVFGTAQEKMKIPFSIADRSIRRESRIIDTFIKLLDMHSGRLNAVEVLSLLDVPAVLRKFRITEAEPESIRRWVKETQIRWGKDSKDRGALGLPEYEENTWDAGFKRLFLGYALPAGEEELFNGILPYDNIEGIEAVTLGKFYEFIRVLCQAIETLKKTFTLSGWADELINIAETFFQPDQNEQNEINKLITVLSELENKQELSGFRAETDIALITYYLKSRLDNESSGHGFLKKGVTFCSMLPMRSIPFKVICMIGMNHDSFPRESKTPGFDLMRKHPDLGDRSKRNDDRYLFLESLISAREKLYISYVGQSIKDNSTIPPSVLVSEITDYAENFFTFPEGIRAAEFLTIRHKLQAFNPEYFTGKERLFSFSEINRRTAECYIRPRNKKLPPGISGIKLPCPEVTAIDINDLIKFFENPAKYFLRSRLGVQLSGYEDSFETTESFELDGLDTTVLGGSLAEKIIEFRMQESAPFEISSFLEKYYNLNKASGRLPHGNPGKVSFNEVSISAAEFAETVFGLLNGRQITSKAIEAEIDSIRLHGYISSVCGNELIYFRYARIKPKDRIRFWISFLALNAGQDIPTGAKMVLKDDKKICGIYKADIDAIKRDSAGISLRSYCRDRLSELIKIYKDGLTAPIKFSPMASWAYFEELVIKGKENSSAIKKAQAEWNESWRPGTGRVKGEKDELNNRLCFGDADIFDSEFERLAQRIFTPLSLYVKAEE